MKTISRLFIAAVGVISTTAKIRPLAEEVATDPAVIGKRVLSPTVGACSDQCLFKDDNNKWCFSNTPQMLETGWEWFQASADEYYKI